MRLHLCLHAVIPAALLMGTSPLAAQPAGTRRTIRQPDPVTVAVATLTANKDYRAAANAALAGAHEAERSLHDRLRLVQLAADSTGKLKVPLDDAAVKPYKESAADTSLPNVVRIEILNQLSGFLLDQQAGKDLRDFDTRPAWETLASGLQLPALLPGDKASALTNIAKWWEREGNWAKARDTYGQILELDVPANVKVSAQQGIVLAWGNEGDDEQALKQGQEFKLQPADLIPVLKDRQMCLAEARKVLDDNARPEAQRWTVFSSLPFFGGLTANDPVLARETLALCRQYFPAFQAVEPKRASLLLNKFWGMKFVPGLVGAADSALHEYIVWSGGYILKSPALSQTNRDAVRFKLVNSLAVLGRKEELLVAVKSISVDSATPPRTRLWATLLVATLGRDSNANPGTLVKPILGGELSGEDKMWASRNAARTAGRLGDEPAARALIASGDALLKEPPTASIPCRYLPVAPANVTAWTNSPLLKEARNRGTLDRPYGDNLNFLIETDAAVLGRTAATGEKDTGDKATELYTACDERGIFLFINAHDVRCREVLEGLASGGGLEMYLAPGQRQPYYTMLANFPQGDADASAFMTNYPGEHFRWPKREDGTYLSVCEPTGDGFGLVMFFAWELFADKLPIDGVKWQFESIRWTRAGGFSFGGSKSVHNRSSFGEIQFEGLDEKALVVIKRRIVARAVAMYRNALKIQNPVGNWNDSEVGDPEFYQAIVAPEIENLNRFAARVTFAMTDADVNEIFREAVPAWMNLEGRVAAARARYLLEKRAP